MMIDENCVKACVQLPSLNESFKLIKHVYGMALVILDVQSSDTLIKKIVIFTRI